MTFWITSSILLFIIVIASAFGPYWGLYGDAKEESGKELQGVRNNKVGEM